MAPVKRKKKNAHGLNNLFTLFCSNFKFVVIYALFPPNLYFQNFRDQKKMFFPSLGHVATLLEGHSLIDPLLNGQEQTCRRRQ